MIIKEGQFLMFDIGSFSEFNYIGPFQASKEFDQKKVYDEFMDAWRKSIIYDGSAPKPVHFTSWLIDKAYIEPLDTISWYLGDNKLEQNIIWSE